MESDSLPSADSRDTGETAPAGGATTTTTTTTTGVSTCDAGASWGARRDFAFERTTGSDDFVEAVNALIPQSDMAPVAVSSHMDPGCVWMVAFSAPDAAGATETAHATTFTPMQRHPAGLWTAAPQSTGWLRVVDRASRTVWIPIADVTGSATYGEASCASLSAVRVAATIPPSAAALSLMTEAGERTVRELMGAMPSARGWDVRFTFSADIAR
jgi:hypothetical protein